MHTSNDTTTRATRRRHSHDAEPRHRCRCGARHERSDRGRHAERDAHRHEGPTGFCRNRHEVGPASREHRSRLSRDDRRTARHIMALRDEVAALGGTVRLVVELPDLEPRPARYRQRHGSRGRGGRMRPPVLV